MTKYIGGFFELETNLSGDHEFHTDAIFLNTGRACLNLIIKTIKPTRIYLPYFACDALFEPVLLNNIPFEYYKLDANLDPIHLPGLESGEFFIYIDFFGLKTRTVKNLSLVYKNQLIIDNSQTFFAKGMNGIFSFNSARKFFGIPDGAYLYSPFSLTGDFEHNNRIETTHIELRSKGLQDKAFQAFMDYERRLDSSIRLGSEFSKQVLNKVNYQDVITTRKRNFNLYHERFRRINCFHMDENQLIAESFVPFCYPLNLRDPAPINRLHENNIFVPFYWKEVIGRQQGGSTFEKQFSRNTIHLPVDHRYGDDDMFFVIEKVEELILRNS